MTDRVVLITGGSRGLGGALVSTFLQAGDTVATFSRSSTTLVEKCRAEYPGRYVWESIDGIDFDKAAGFVRSVYRRFGRLDVVVNNLGVMKDGLLPMMQSEHIHEIIALNVECTARIAREAARYMMKQGSGVIINVSSVTGLRGFRGVAVYGATKAAIDGLTRGLARELGSRGIRVNSVAPGHLETETGAHLEPRQLEQIARRTPLQRLPEMGDVTPVVEFLASPAAGFITGQTLVIDGGLTC
jgi:3-oxoacyl-[acyl-carrier protein] reductase